MITLILSIPVLTGAGCSPKLPATFRIGMNNWPGYAPLYLASIQSTENGEAAYQLVPMASSTDVMHGLRSGTLEGGALTLDEAIVLSSEGIALRIVLIFDISNGADVLLAHPQYSELAQLRGRTIGVEKSTVGTLVLKRALETAGLMPADIQTRYCSYENHESCFADVDALVTFEPAMSRLMAKGAVNLFDSQQMPNEIVDVLVVTEVAHRALQTQVALLVGQYYQARQTMLTTNIVYQQVLADFTGMTITAFEQALAGMLLPDRVQTQQFMTGSPAPLQQQIDQLYQFLSDHHGINATSPNSLTIDAQYVDDSQ